MPKAARVWIVGDNKQLAALDALVTNHPTLATDARRAMIYLCPFDKLDEFLLVANEARVYAEALTNPKTPARDCSTWWKKQRLQVLERFYGAGWFTSKDVVNAKILTQPYRMLGSMVYTDELEHRGAGRSSAYRVPDRAE